MRHSNIRITSVAGPRLPNLAVDIDEDGYERENKEQVNQNARDVIHDVTSHPREERLQTA
jgi:hypothetical protein